MNATQEMWDRYERGDALKLEEVQGLIRQTDEALPYLLARKGALGTTAVSEAAGTLVRLKGFERHLVKQAAERRA